MSRRFGLKSLVRVLVLLLLFFSCCGSSDIFQQRYASIDKATFDLYTPQWLALHESWIGINEAAAASYCAPHDGKESAVSYPLCVGDKIVKESYPSFDSLLRAEQIEKQELVGDEVCPAAVCSVLRRSSLPDEASLTGRTVATCAYTPHDTIDYLPPVLQSSLDSETICSYPSGYDADPLIPCNTLGMDEGLPPQFTPLHAIRLNITGRVLTMLGDKCYPVPNALIEAWQLDPTALTEFTVEAQRFHSLDRADEALLVVQSEERDAAVVATMNSEATALQTELQLDQSLPLNESLRAISCRARQHSHVESGEFRFSTLLPPSYGPPRHIMFQISAPGYSTLTTRMYFAQDYRLQQLTTLAGEEAVRGFGSLPAALGFNSDRGFEQSRFPGAVSKDPRVAELHFVSSNSDDSSSSLMAGVFTTAFNFVLRPVHGEELSTAGSISADTNTASKVDATASEQLQQPLPPYDISGLWADAQGGLVQVETFGPSFVAHEYPHPRSWGTALGVVVGNAIRNVNFRQVHSDADLLAARDLFDNPQVDFQPLNSVWTATSAGVSTGTIIPANEFASAAYDATLPAALSIEWSAAAADTPAAAVAVGRWTKQQSDATTRSGVAAALAAGGYRFLKLLIQRQTGGFDDGRVVINELEFFEGVLAQTKRPLTGFEMVSPRTPAPQAVTCSSFRSQDHHCYRAFDGDASSSSQWITAGAAGSRRNKLNSGSSGGEWVTFDFGANRGVRPTAMRIVCNAQNAASEGPLGCPMTFALLGSHDNQKFDVIHRVDLFDYANDYALSGDGSRSFHFAFASATGRPLGQQCGSCTAGPRFSCHLDAYDGTCDSKYCGSDGRCALLPDCPAGQYLYLHLTQGVQRPQYECRLCAAGRFGNSSGLVGPACSGICTAGFYCPPGSTNATQFQCGGSGVFCPRGSGQPLAAAAGRYTAVTVTTGVANSSSPDTSAATSAVRTLQLLCERGHYCQGGVQLPCPVGTYGNERGLRSALCSARGSEDADPGCVAGYYCPLGSVLPLLCPRGYFCPDGRLPVVCPAGTYGADEGLKDRRCSGLCTAGFYCEAGSVSATSAACPAGRYGSVAGLTNSSCSGLCFEGHYCPSASSSGSQLQCGGSEFYCPTGSPEPVPVSEGFYTVGGGSELTRSAQRIAEFGFYATRGERWPCRPGTFGASLGLSADIFLALNISSSDSGSDSSGDDLDAGSSANNSANATAAPSAAPSWSPTLLPSSNFSEQPSSMPSAAPFADIFSSFAPTFSPTFESMRPRTAFLCSGLCAAGYYCPVNSSSAVQLPCPAGRYGATEGLTTAQCTAVCPLGHYCPAASTAPIKCPAGVFGNVTGLTDATCSSVCWEGGCSANQNLCSAGYFCPEGSIQADQLPCGGPDKFCPQGSAAPTAVAGGHYTIGGPDESGAFPTINAAHTRIAQAICEEGFYCVGGVRSPCPAGVYGASKGLQSPACTAPCPAGHFCPSASTNGTTHRCPAGRFGAVEGLRDSSCSGECSAGFHCYEGATSPTQLECAVLFLSAAARNSNVLSSLRQQGISTTTFVEADFLYIDEAQQRANVYLSDFNTTVLRLPSTSIEKHVASYPNSVFCPKGTGIPLTVRPGYYTEGGNRTTRSSQQPCPMGTYCTRGELFLCPAGTYGRAERLSDSSCTGLCARGHYCPEGSTSRTQRRCPVGHYGASEGLTTALCSGTCPQSLDCPEASIAP